MNASPLRDQVGLMILHESQRSAEISLGHPTIRQNAKSENVDARLAISINMHMGGLMVIRVDDKAHASFTKNSNHAEE
jgi:hypothetical protein